MPNIPFNSPLTLPALDPQPLPASLREVLCPSDQPLVLLPVRLETRFFPQPDGSHELRVRVYPDKVHLDAHETELTRAERDWGIHYWEQDWRAAGDSRARAAAWRQLADRYGAERAAWIVRVSRPGNPHDRPATPVDTGTELPVPPQFPTIPVAGDDAASWRRAPRADLLPDRWIAIVSAGGAPVLAATGRDIERPLAVGPDPKTPPADIPGDRLAIDDGMRWMVDFDAAEAKGMALRIAVPPAVLDRGIDSLFVLGAAAAVDPLQASTALAGLLDAQHYTDGLEFLRSGTPSNNTSERRAGYGAEDPGHENSFAHEIAVDPSSLATASNAARLGAALGWSAEQSAEVLGRVRGGARQDELDARSMNAALWQVGWGYFLSNMIGRDGTGLTADDLAWAREHFVSRVRSAGPFAALRCGRQPYGILPVTSLDRWQPRAGSGDPKERDLWLRDLLVKLRDRVWRPQLAEVPRVGRRQNPLDPDADLADVMRLEGVSTGYRLRSLLGRHYLQHLRAFLGEDLQASGFLHAADDLAGDLIARLGFTWRPRVARGTYADMWWRLSVPLVQAGEVSPWRTLEPDYIGALLDQPHIADIVAAHPDPAAPGGASLLQTLLRHALLREYAHAAALIAASTPGVDVERLLRDEELVDLVPGTPPLPTWSRQLDLVVPAVTGAKTLRAFLEGLTTFDAPGVRALGEFRRSLEHLQRLDSEALQLLMQGTLDLSAHRLDAWITSFATQRLAEVRDAAPRGVRVGGYGWLENLFPAPTSGVPVPVPPGETGPLAAPVGDSGFIHAPSLTHAATAALLRNAHVGSGTAAQAEGPFAIDLSSRRVRDATWLLDGMRQEQPLGALLGYRLERRLHELGMDRLLHPLRELAPLTARRLEQTTLPVEAIAANNVVDGDALFRQWRSNPAQVRARLRDEMARAGSANLPSDADLAALGRELDAVGDAIDAVSDALTAEAAYQIVRGNTSRTASTLKAIAEGDAPPPELEVTRMPRTGVALTHRVVVLFAAAAGPTPGWAGPERSPRATAEPVLNAWAARLLGDGRKIRCTVEQIAPAGDAVLAVRTFPLGDLPLAPLDVVHGVGAAGEQREAAAARIDLEDRVLEAARRRPDGFGPEAQLRLQHARPADLAPDEITLFEAIEHARAIRALVGAARGADPDDLQPAEQSASGVVDLAEFETRVMAAEDALLAAHDVLASLVQGSATVGIGPLRGALLALQSFGLGLGTGAPTAGDDEAAVTVLLRQAQALLQESRGRVDRVAAARAVPPADDPRRRREELTERLRTVFGAGFLAMPLFTLEPSAATDLRQALDASTAVQDGDPLAVHTWFIRAERVRDGVARLGAPLRVAEILGTGERLDVRVAQLPFVADDRWVGLPSLPGRDPHPGKLSLVVQAPEAIDTTKPLTGLWVDEWVEVIPSREETTAIAFQYDPPDACAPQSILIAVPPDPAEDWTVASLHRVLAETLDLAKLRAVGVESLGEVAHYLPALFFAFNTQDEAVSTDFGPLTTNRAG